jgi:hypothetical protein
MAVPIQAQPPKPPSPPKVETAAKADPKPAAEAKPAAQAAPAPRPAQTPDLFEVASGGGRPVPWSGGSSFTPAVSAAQSQLKDALSSANAATSSPARGSPGASQLKDALSSANAQLRSDLSGAQTDLRNAFATTNDAARQAFTDFQSSFNDLRPDLGNIWGGGAGPVSSGPGALRFDGGAPGGVVDRPVTSFNLSDLFSQNFNNGPPGQFLQDQGGGSKPGIGGSDFLRALGGGALPASSAPQTAVSTQPSSPSRQPFNFDFSFDFGGRGNRFGIFNFGNQRGGGGGAAGGVADRWDR